MITYTGGHLYGTVRQNGDLFNLIAPEVVGENDASDGCQDALRKGATDGTGGYGKVAGVFGGRDDVAIVVDVVIVSVIGLATQKEKRGPAIMLIGSVLCAVFAGLCWKGYRKR